MSLKIYHIINTCEWRIPPRKILYILKINTMRWSFLLQVQLRLNYSWAAILSHFKANDLCRTLPKRHPDGDYAPELCADCPHNDNCEKIRTPIYRIWFRNWIYAELISPRWHKIGCVRGKNKEWPDGAREVDRVIIWCGGRLTIADETKLCGQSKTQTLGSV